MAMERSRKFCGPLFLLLLFPMLPHGAISRHNGSKDDARGFWIADDMFWKDGRPFQIIGGDLHYFRVLPQYWEDRLSRAKALGLNAIQTYVPWNLHEPISGQWVFDGIADIESYLKSAQELGFLVLLRVGPYICGEWDLGGFPAWLLSLEPAIKLRSSDSPIFLQLVERWWNVLLPRITPYLYENGGPIVMVQIENEFGSYGDDQQYLRHFVALARKHLGDKVILYTTDGGTWNTLENGSIHGEEIFTAVDFSTGEDAWSIFKMQKTFNAQGKSPPFSAEFYTGWLTHWREKVAKTDAEFTAQELEKILSRNGSVVLYMAHGGTNFGFYNGANTGQNAFNYKADLTSYDYDAPIEESGDVDNLKFKALRNVIEKYRKTSLPAIPSNNEKTKYGHVKMIKVTTFFEALDSLSDPTNVIHNKNPMSMESVGQMFGFLLYMSKYSGKESEIILSIQNVHDRAQVFISCELDGNDIDPKYVGVIERWSNKDLTIPNLRCPSNASLFILVENLGRVNYGPFIYDRKGILSDVILDGISLNWWRMFPIDLYNVNRLLPTNTIMQVADSKNDFLFDYSHTERHAGADFGIPSFFQGKFFIDQADEVHDTFVSLRGWTKGVVFVNNFNLGRFWTSVGPQCTLYVPAPILRHGENIVIIFELHPVSPSLKVSFIDYPDFSCGPKAQQT